MFFVTDIAVCFHENNIRIIGAFYNEDNVKEV